MSESPPTFLCPVTRDALRPAKSGELATLNHALAARPAPPNLPEGTPLALPLVAALAESDGRWFYPIHDGIPVLIPEMRMGPDAVPFPSHSAQNPPG